MMLAHTIAASAIVLAFAMSIASITTGLAAESVSDEVEEVQIYDEPTPSIQFIRPRPNEIIKSETVLFFLRMDNYYFRPDLALKPSLERYGEGVQVPNEGHYQLHLVRPGSTEVRHFAEPGSVAVRARLEPGPWCAYTTLVHHDNTQRLKARPKDLPPFDKVCFRILPPTQEAEPATENDGRKRTSQRGSLSSLHLAGAPYLATTGSHVTRSSLSLATAIKIHTNVMFSDGTIFSDGFRWSDD